jgi:hypothetical protein
MAPVERRRPWLIVGGAVVALLIAGLAAILFKARDHAPTTPPPASTGGLVVQAGRPDDAKLDPNRSLRCFVAGQFEGVETLAACARKNGVATEALDVGIDQTGALAATDGQTGAVLTPLPPPASSEPPAEPAPDAAPVASAAPSPPTGDCLRYVGATWRKVGSAMPLSACAQALFSGHCEKPGGASYGRWADQSLRLTPRRVEISADNHNFRTLVEQTDDGCVVPQF